MGLLSWLFGDDDDDGSGWYQIGDDENGNNRCQFYEASTGKWGRIWTSR